eukprot:1485804-Pyramimonas_sp.AAC.1
MRATYQWDKRKKAYVRKVGDGKDRPGGDRNGATHGDFRHGKGKDAPGVLYKQWSKRTHKTRRDAPDPGDRLRVVVFCRELPQCRLHGLPRPQQLYQGRDPIRRRAPDRAVEDGEVRAGQGERR